MRLSDTEWIVMGAVWRDSPASVRDVLERVENETGWAYTTVKTILARLVEKGALKTHKRANTSLYEPLVSRQLARRSAIRSLLDRAFDGAFGSLFQHLVSDEKLSKRDRQQLTLMLDELDAEGESRR